MRRKVSSSCFSGAGLVAELSLAHQQDFLTQTPLKRVAVKGVALAVVVFVGTVEKVDPQIHRPMNQLNGIGLVPVPHISAAHAHKRHPEAALAERSHGHRPFGRQRNRYTHRGTGDGGLQEFTTLHVAS